jgi:hypothetical protein
MHGFLLVDDRDGSELKRASPELAEAFCLVRFDRQQGSLIGTETTMRIRSLT